MIFWCNYLLSFVLFFSTYCVQSQAGGGYESDEGGVETGLDILDGSDGVNIVAEAHPNIITCE